MIYDYESQNINEPHPHTEWTSHINTYYLDNGVNNKKTEAVKIYNKTQALAEKGVEEEFLPKSDILRFEITLKTSEFICKKLGTSNIHELSDENINEYFDHFILKRLIKISLVNYNSSLYNSVFSIIPSKKELHCTNWIGHFLTTLVSYEINEHKIYLLDSDVVLGVVNSNDFRKYVRGRMFVADRVRNANYFIFENNYYRAAWMPEPEELKGKYSTVDLNIISQEEYEAYLKDRLEK